MIIINAAQKIMDMKNPVQTIVLNDGSQYINVDIVNSTSDRVVNFWFKDCMITIPLNHIKRIETYDKGE